MSRCARAAFSCVNGFCRHHEWFCWWWSVCTIFVLVAVPPLVAGHLVKVHASFLVRSAALSGASWSVEPSDDRWLIG